MPGEWDLNQQGFTCYRKLENFSATGGTALVKRSGTKLLEFSNTFIFKLFSTEEVLFSFRADDTYSVFKISTGEELKKRAPSPIPFTDLSSARVEESSKNGVSALRFYTKNAWYTSDDKYDVSKITVTQLPDGTELNLTISIGGRSVVAYNGNLYFSKYGALEDFTTGTKPEDAFIYTSVSGVDNEITDIVFYSEIIAFSTKTTLYGLYPPLVNPLLSGQVQSNLNHRLFKLYTAGVTPGTLAQLGNGLVFANSHGVYLLNLRKDNRMYAAEDLTEQAQHIVSESGQKILKVARSLNRENVFFVLRNDGVLFNCFFDENQRAANWSRQTAGAVRTYKGVDNNATAFVSQYAGYSYVELRTSYPYFSDNRLRFSLNDELENFASFSFLDAYKAYGSILNIKAYPSSPNEFKSKAELEPGRFYTILTDEQELKNIKIRLKGGKGPTYTYYHNDEILKVFTILGEFFDTIDVSEPLKYQGAENLYVTYAKLGGGRLTLETKLVLSNVIKDLQVDSFFCVVGFGYKAVAHVYAHPSGVEDEFPADLLQVGSYCSQRLEISTYTDTGIKRSNNEESRYGSTFYPANIPGVAWATYKHILFTSPEGESCVLLGFGTNTQAGSEQNNN